MNVLTWATERRSSNVDTSSENEGLFVGSASQQLLMRPYLYRVSVHTSCHTLESTKLSAKTCTIYLPTSTSEGALLVVTRNLIPDIYWPCSPTSDFWESHSCFFSLGTYPRPVEHSSLLHIGSPGSSYLPGLKTFSSRYSNYNTLLTRKHFLGPRMLLSEVFHCNELLPHLHKNEKVLHFIRTSSGLLQPVTRSEVMSECL